MSFDKQIPKKGDQRQMEMWQRVGVYAAGLALGDAGLAGKPELLDHTDMIVAAIGGERDVPVDTAILAGARKAEKPGAFLNERLMNDLRPTLFLAQLPNLLAGNISIVHGVVGSSRTFLGEESAGVDAVRVAQARVAAGQSEVTLVGGASPRRALGSSAWTSNSAARRSRASSRRFGIAAPRAGSPMRSLGRFWCSKAPSMRKRAAPAPRARISAICVRSQPAATKGEIEATLGREWDTIAAAVDRAHAAVISGATGLEPATSAERRALGKFGLPVRNTGTYIGHGIEAQFAGQSGHRLHGDRARQTVCAYGKRRHRRKSVVAVAAHRHQRWLLARRRAGAARTGRLKERVDGGEPARSGTRAAATRDKAGRPHRRRHRDRRGHLARRRQGRQLGEIDGRRFRHPPHFALSDRRPAKPRSPAPSITSTRTTWRPRNFRSASRCSPARRRSPNPASVRKAISPGRYVWRRRRSKSNGRRDSRWRRWPAANADAAYPGPGARRPRIRREVRRIPIRHHRRAARRAFRHRRIADLAQHRLRVRRDRHPART